MLKTILLIILLALPLSAHSETYLVGALHEVIYFEARGESLEGMVAVAQVVLNRVSHKKFPNSISSVRSQRKQFSYYRKPFTRKMYEEKMARSTLLVAIAVYSGLYYDLRTATSTLYHACDGKHKVKPRWDWSKLKFDAKIGNHCFYSLRR
jgi:spore germination cell wall hydrolase CwlJ-like protein